MITAHRVCSDGLASSTRTFSGTRVEFPACHASLTRSSSFEPAYLSFGQVRQMLVKCRMALATCIATSLEKRRPLAVDALVPNPLFSATHAITIDAPPEQVWPWIAQMGGGRAGWYSWDAIDNGGRPSATSIVPELQTIVRGQVMPALPGAKDAFVVEAVDPPRDLVL